MLTSTHWAALPRHTDEVNTWRQTVYFRAGGHTIHAHTCHTWSWVCKPAAALCMLLSRINTTWEGKVSHWQTIPPVIRASISLFTSTTRTAGSWISHLMHTSKLRTLRNCTMHLSCLWEYHRSALQYKKGNMEKNKIYICKTRFIKSDLTDAGGAVVWTQGPRLPITELLSIQHTYWVTWPRVAEKENVGEVSQSLF